MTLLAALFCLPAAAADVGVGSTVSIQPSFLDELLQFQQQYYGYAYGASPTGGIYPSLDLRIGETVFQFHLIETLTTAAAEGDQIYVGLNGFNTPLSGELGGKWSAFGGLGGSLDIMSIEGEASVIAGPIAPIGVRVGDDTRLALYAIPGLNLVSAGGDTTVIGAADLVASVWF